MEKKENSPLSSHPSGPFSLPQFFFFALVGFFINRPRIERPSERKPVLTLLSLPKPAGHPKVKFFFSRLLPFHYNNKNLFSTDSQPVVVVVVFFFFLLHHSQHITHAHKEKGKFLFLFFQID